ncbi:MAG: response regulator transcription factor [Hymenobacter sp.]|nr:MAG: response regulator transcription factor [Hymenobacter sp.]
MIRIFLVDDHAVLRQGLRDLLADQPGITIVGEASNGQELLDQLPTVPADVVLLDLNMPGMGGLETTQQLQKHHPAVRVLVLSMLSSAEHILQMLDAGAQGYVLKNAGLAELTFGIQMAAAGQLFLCAEVGFAALHQLRAARHPLAEGAAEKANSLSKREMEVLQLIAEGLTNQEIADRLYNSKRTIETHRQNIMEKTGAKNTAALVRYAVGEGLLA